MNIPFAKYAGCGNDFILLDNRERTITLTALQISQLCHRQRGIGADGLIFLEDSPLSDFKMRIFNADGSEAEMCGNGLRCLIKFIRSLGIDQESYRIEVMQQEYRASIQEDLVCVEMRSPTNVQWNIPLQMEDFSLHFLNTGVPHVVIFTSHLEEIDVQKWGAAIRHHPHFAPHGTNVNFAQIITPNEIRLRTYERGVENETLACGTGATAVALAASHQHQLSGPLQIRTASNECLTIGFESTVTMTGPAEFIFQGLI